MASKEHWVYILKCQDGTLYTGYTNDLAHRIRMHEEGKGAKYTRGRGPFHLMYTCAFEDKSDAMRAEYRIKKLPRHEKLAMIQAYEKGMCDE
ncbi:GIY-YIG nuclease family protein [Oceanobacillus sp. CFH 90083]|uniref:GIY-YIG nuclease family protein n=1 Tax=Oceanobacillus sp. CFH 90083 TaxID=2592336 RepID=UPI00128B1085|nr:GIY-YIG nuclease family protein [Oceanobacillus sp. CFH 90083]